jgi:hypothetical protein
MLLASLKSNFQLPPLLPGSVSVCMYEGEGEGKGKGSHLASI